MGGPSRRSVVSAAAASLIASAARAAQTDGRTKLIILGARGGPVVGAAEHQTSHVILVGGDAYVVDCGYGVTELLVKAGVPLPSIRDIYITHHHPDHDIELGVLVYFAWYAGLDRPLGIYGPPPIARMMAGHRQAMKPDVDVWLKDIGHKPMPPIGVHEVSRPGPVMADAKVKVTCCLVNHPPVVPALGYRFDTPGRSIVFSGDTTPVESLARLAKGADVLVHEALWATAFLQAAQPGQARAAGQTGSTIAGDAQKLREHILRSHTPVEEAGRIAQEAGVKTLVLSHRVNAPGVSDEMWRAAAAKAFKGEIIVAHDGTVV